MATKEQLELRELLLEYWIKSDPTLRLLNNVRQFIPIPPEVAAKIAQLEAEVARLSALTSRTRPTLPGKLSVGRIEKLIKDGKVGSYGDGGNLWLQISNGGRAVSWLFRWKLQGRGENMGLGSYKDVGLDEAREQAWHYRKLLRRGLNPKAERDNARLDEEIAAGRAKTVSQVVDEYFEAKIARKSASYREITEGELKTYVKDKIGDMPIQKVDLNAILETCGLRDLWTQKNPTATHVQMHLDRIFKLAIRKKYYRGENPAAWEVLQDVLPSSRDVHQVKHHASLPYKDASRFIQALRTHEYKGHWRMASGLRLNGKHALEFIALTGGRTSEVLKATWKEFDLQHRIWNVPPEHLKTGYRHGEPLPRPITRPMLAVLEEMQRRRADQSPDAIVFRSAHKGQLRPLQRTALSHLVQRLLNWEVKITNHGFRSTLRDWCRANKYPSEWWDIQVDHVLGNKTSQAYGPDKLLEERRGMMEAWGEYCTRPAPEPHSADVVKLSEKRKRRSA